MFGGDGEGKDVHTLAAIRIVSFSELKSSSKLLSSL